MRFFNEIMADLKAGRAFPNGASWEHWAQFWCNGCVFEVDCPIVAAAMVGEGTPREWDHSIGAGGYVCSEYIGRGKRSE